MALELATAEAAIIGLIRSQGLIPSTVPVAPAPYQETDPRPAVIFKLSSSKDIRVFDEPSIQAVFVYQIVVEGAGDTIAAVKDLSVALHRSLDNQTFSSADGEVLAFTRQSFISLPYRSRAGKQYQMVGGMYRIAIHSVY